jgi:hypothetical protein
MCVEIENQHPLGPCLERGVSREHEAVESAETAAGVAARVVKTARERSGFLSALQRRQRRGDGAAVRGENHFPETGIPGEALRLG